MILAIRSVKDCLNIAKERVVLVATGSGDIGSYVLARARSLANGAVGSSLLSTFWFPDKRVERGDLVIVYTKAGVERQNEAPSGIRRHLFYLGRSEAIWRPAVDSALVIEIRDWNSVAVTREPTLPGL